MTVVGRTLHTYLESAPTAKLIKLDVSRKFERPIAGDGMSIDMQTVVTLSPKIQGDAI